MMYSTEQLLTLSRRLHGAADLSAALVSVNTFIAGNTRYRACWIVVHSLDSSYLELLGNPRPEIQGAKLRMESIVLEDDALLSHLFTSEEPRCFPDLRLEPMADPAQVAHFGNRTLIVVPMLPLGNRVGALCVGTFSEVGIMEPTAREFDLIVRVASLLTLVLSRIRSDENAREVVIRSQTNQRLESLGRMAGEVAHDFNNILTAISGNADLALRDLGEHPAREYIEEVQAASKRAADLSRQLLTFSKGEPIQPTPLALPQIMNGLERMLERLVPKHIELLFQSATDLPYILAERSQIEQVVVNLVLNARDAMPREGLLTVRTTLAQLNAEQLGPSTHAVPGAFVCISVQDNGQGIHQDTLPNIFEPFYSTKASSQGTGLGLSVVRSVIQKHCGHLDLSTGAKGTTFSAYFPTTEHQPKPESAPVKPSGRKPNELVVIADDQPQIRKLLGRVLESAGYQVQICVDGEQVMHFIETNPQVALVLSDVSMPKMGGLELITKLQNRPKAPAVVLMSGYNPGDEIPQNTNILTKPFGMGELLSLLDQVLEARHAPRAS
ncbi:MAG: signal transduction histidine kinase [Cognaticolwellia sp.]|jgi:signal transduction histidine kinase